MLSIDKNPADPSCQLLTNSSNESQLQPQVDLPNNHLPNFSIRDYVFTARSKDVKKNWPFSLKNLQLCLKHGVKDVLPPFELLETVKNQSFKRCTVESSNSLDKEKITSISFDKEEPSSSSRQEKDVVLLGSSDDHHPQLNSLKLVPESCVISSFRSGAENDFPSTTTSVSQSEIEYPSKKSEIQSLPRHKRKSGTVTVEAAAGTSGIAKSESNSRPVSSKKCRLIVKFGSNSDRNSTEDIASNSTTTVSETMASKVCPLCKTFSSTSNTTLNAHIDQCLSTESTPKWTADSKLTRHRIKPRKMRLMVDVYSTAKPCTLEELDQRNGTSWALVSSLLTQNNEKIESSDGGKKQRVSTNHPDDVGDVGPVYIDSNGTKLRILSKLNDQVLLSKAAEDVGVKETLKGDKGMKCILEKKKKRLAQKHQKFFKLAPHSKKIFSHKTLGSQISSGQEECLGEAKSSEKHLMSKHSNLGNSETLRPWVCSKRRGFTKKIAGQEGHQTVRNNWHLARDLLVENSPSVSGDSLAERNHVKKFTSLSENFMSSANNETSEKSANELTDQEQSPGSKQMDNLLVENQTSDNMESFSPSMKKNSNQLARCNSSVDDNCMWRPSSTTKNHSSLLRKKTVDTWLDTAADRDVSCFASSKSSRTAHAIVSKAMKFSFRKNISANSQLSGGGSKPGKIKKWSALKKSQARLMKKRDEEARTWDSEVDHEITHGDADNQVEGEELTEEVSLKRSSVLETRQGRGFLCFSQEEEASALRSSKSTSHCYEDDVQRDEDSSGGLGDDFLQKVDCLESSRNADDAIEQPFSRNSDRSMTNLIKPVDSGFYDLSNSLKVQANYGGLLYGTEEPTVLTRSDFVNDHEMFSADKVGTELAGHNVEIEVDLDSDTGHDSSFPEVDPIPIPGPPGSFLPSPRDMGSEDFQGNSSLTTSRVHSSLEQHDVIDGDSSDSPMSAASTISNPSACRSEFNYSEPSSLLGPYAAEDRIRSTSASAEPSLQSAGISPESTVTEMERIGFNREYLKLDRIFFEKGSLNFKNDQPCCCQRKERLNLGEISNYQESQLLRRRKLASMSVPVGGKQMDFNSNLRPADMDVRPELAPNNCSNSGSEKAVLPVVKPLASPIPFKEFPSTGVRLLARSDSDSASPSASNPILRLMGKNLLVVNKDEDATVPLAGNQSHVQNNNQTSQFQAFSRITPGNVQNQDYFPVHQAASQVLVHFGQNSHTAGGLHFDGGLSNGFRSQSDLRLPANVRLPMGMFQDQRTDTGYATSMECHDYNVSGRRLKSRLNASSVDTIVKVISTPDRHSQHSDSSMNPVKEIIIIDDLPDDENAVIRDVTKYTEGWRASPVMSSGISIPTVPSYNPNIPHYYSSYQLEQHPSMGELPLMHRDNFHATQTKLGNAGPISWNCIPEGPAMLQRSPFTAVSSSPGHLRSPALHFPPGFS